MKEAEQKAFEKRLQEDEDFAFAYQAFLAAVRTVTVEGRERDREKIRKILDEESDDDSRWGSGRPWILLAASLALLLSSILVFRSIGGVDPTAVFNQYFEAYPDLITKMSGSEPDHAIQQGMEAYGKENWPVVIENLTEVPDSHPDYHLTRIYLGTAFLLSDQEDSAIKSFQIVIDFGPEEMKSNGYWNRGMTMLKQGEKESALSDLEKATTLDPSRKATLTEIRKALE